MLHIRLLCANKSFLLTYSLTTAASDWKRYELHLNCNSFSWVNSTVLLSLSYLEYRLKHRRCRETRFDGRRTATCCSVWCSLEADRWSTDSAICWSRLQQLETEQRTRAYRKTERLPSTWCTTSTRTATPDPQSANHASVSYQFYVINKMIYKYYCVLLNIVLFLYVGLLRPHVSDMTLCWPLNPTLRWTVVCFYVLIVAVDWWAEEINKYIKLKLCVVNEVTSFYPVTGKSWTSQSACMLYY